MITTPADIVTLITVIVSLYVAIINGRKTRAEAEAARAGMKATEADAVKSYAETAVMMSEKWQDYDKQLSDLNVRQAELTNQIEAKNERIEALETKITELMAGIIDRDNKITELERLTLQQETEIQTLRAELAKLGKRRGKC
jgi:chromosome segregation ATPase